MNTKMTEFLDNSIEFDEPKAVIDYQNLDRKGKRQLNRYLYKASLNNLGHTLKVMTDMHGITENNWLQEFFDNMIGYGGSKVIALIKINSDNSVSVICANNKSRITDDMFKNGWLEKPIDFRPDRDRTTSVGNSNVGASNMTYRFGYFDKIGYCTPDLKYRIAEYSYKLSDGISIDKVSPAVFKNKLEDISVTVNPVSKEEWLNTHSCGDTFDGWFYSFKLFKNPGFKINQDSLESFLRLRFNERSQNKSMTLKIVDKDETIFETKLRNYYFPTNLGNVYNSINNQIPLYVDGVDSDGKSFNTNQLYTFFTGDSNDVINQNIYTFSLSMYHAVAPSDIERRDKLLKEYGNSLHPLHMKKLDRPMVDVYSADGTYVCSFWLYVDAQKWPAQYNQIKVSVQLDEESALPFGFKKDEFKDEEFVTKMRELIRVTIAENNQLHITEGQERKKAEDDMVIRHRRALFAEDGQTPNDESNAYTNLLLLLNVDSINSINDVKTFCKETINAHRECDEVVVTHNNNVEQYHLLEWQKGCMNDEHFGEFITRLLDPGVNWTNAIWICEEISSKYVDLMKKYFSEENKKIKKNKELKSIKVISASDLYSTNGISKAIKVWSNN